MRLPVLSVLLLVLLIFTQEGMIQVVRPHILILLKQTLESLTRVQPAHALKHCRLLKNPQVSRSESSAAPAAQPRETSCQLLQLAKSSKAALLFFPISLPLAIRSHP